MCSTGPALVRTAAMLGTTLTRVWIFNGQLCRAQRALGIRCGGFVTCKWIIVLSRNGEQTQKIHYRYGKLKWVVLTRSS